MFLIRVLTQYAALLLALTVHEYCHGLVAHIQGDDTAERMGRLTLNPFAHADMFGTILLPLIAIFTGLPVFGWAKPVPYNPYNLRNQRWGPVAVALAGPAVNLLMAAIFLTALTFLAPIMGTANLLIVFLIECAVINIVLAVFNFIPVPPLDGSKLLNALLDSPKYMEIRRFLELRGQTILLIIIGIDLLTPFSILGGIFNFAVNSAFSLFHLLPLLYGA